MKNRESHPSYGMVSINRIQGNPGPLFGSSLDSHYTSFRIRVSHGIVMSTELGEDRYMADNKQPIVELQISATQFTELITNMNSGDGIPCTIMRLAGKHVESPPAQTMERNKIKDDFQARVEKLTAGLSAIQEEAEQILSKKSIGKADRENLLDNYKLFRMEIEKNLPFILEVFNESTEKSISAAKVEVDTFITNMMVAIGAKGMKQNLLGAEPSIEKQLNEAE